MTNEVSIPKANPNLNAQGAFQFMNRPMESQYYESEYSVFGNPYNGPIGTTPGNFGALATPMFPTTGTSTGVDAGTAFNPAMTGMGMGMFGFGGMYGNVDKYVDNAKKWNNGYHDIMDNNSDRSSETEMKNQSNRNIVNGLADSLTYDLSRMKDNIANNDMRQACDNYDNLYKLIAKREGVEIKYHNGRIIKDEHINAQIAKCYKEVTGSDLMGDISAYGDGNITNGFKRTFTLGTYEQGAADEIKAYMTGDRLQDSKARASHKVIGGIAGGAAAGATVTATTAGVLGGLTWAGATVAGSAKGAKFGKALGTKGALVGAVAGAVIGAIAGGFFGNNSPDKKNMEKVSNY